MRGLLASVEADSKRTSFPRPHDGGVIHPQRGSPVILYLRTPIDPLQEHAFSEEEDFLRAPGAQETTCMFEGGERASLELQNPPQNDGIGGAAWVIPAECMSALQRVRVRGREQCSTLAKHDRDGSSQS